MAAIVHHSCVSRLIDTFQTLVGERNNRTSQSQQYHEMIQQMIAQAKYFKNEMLQELIQFGNILAKQTGQRWTEHAVDTTVKNVPTFKLNRSRYELLDNYVTKMHSSHLKVVSALTEKAKRFTIHPGPIENLTNCQKWHNSITQHALYQQYGPTIGALLNDLGSMPITGMGSMTDYGTEIKAIFQMADGSKSLFKPMRVRRDEERNPNHFVFDEFERHHSEIAAFHLDRLMQFHRVPPNSGRTINITRDIERYAISKINNTIYTSPAGNKCFHGRCDYYCDTANAACATPERPHVIEGSITVDTLLP